MSVWTARPIGGALIAEAAAYAIRLHTEQMRVGREPIPYAAHVAAVAALVARAEPTAKAETLAAAFLHDVVEDTEATDADLRGRFGDAVADLVAWLTDDPETAALPTEQRKAAQAAKIAAAPRPVKLVKLADQTDNIEGRLADAELWTAERQARYLAGCRRVVDSCRGAAPALEARFDAAAAALDAHLKLSEETSTP